MDKQAKTYLWTIVIGIVLMVAGGFPLFAFIALCLFQLCVYFLEWLGEATYTGYVGISVILFCVALPIYLIWSIFQLRKRKRIIKEMLKTINELNIIIDGLEKEEQFDAHE